MLRRAIVASRAPAAPDATPERAGTIVLQTRRPSDQDTSGRCDELARRGRSTPENAAVPAESRSHYDHSERGTTLAHGPRVTRHLLFALFSIACAEEVGRAPTELTIAPGEVLLDRRDGAALYGRLLEGPDHGDGDRVLTLRSERAGRPFLGELEGTPVLDARFGDGETIFVLGADRVLRDRTAAIDDRVIAPLSVVGSTVAYARGEMPDYEIARADARTGAVETITQGMAPAWSPALSPDGRELVFVSSVTGTPRLYRWQNGSARLLPPSDRFPTTPVAPRWENGVLSFEDEAGAAQVVIQ